jgi:hypothetical protein
MKLIKPTSIILLIILLVTSFCLAKVPPLDLSIKEYDIKNIEHLENQLSNNVLNKISKYNVSLDDKKILFMLPLIGATDKIMDEISCGDYYEDQ